MSLRIDLHVHIHQDPDTRLDRILEAVTSLVLKGDVMSQALDSLATQVEQLKTVEQSAVTLIKGLADQLTAIKDDPAKIEALAAELKSTSEDLAAAVAANTPAAPPAPAPTEPPTT
jgi:ABC-type transporter Mla subunit MlaD